MAEPGAYQRHVRLLVSIVLSMTKNDIYFMPANNYSTSLQALEDHTAGFFLQTQDVCRRMYGIGIFEVEKRRALERLHKEGADDDIAGLIELLNGFDEYFTTSSCSGRIILICIPEVGAKEEAEFIAKWHRKVGKDEVLKAIGMWKDADDADGELWLMSQSPILHVSCVSIEKAKQLLSLAIESGFKYSGIKSITMRRVMVEIMSTERMDVPVGKEGVIFCSEPYLDFIVSSANFMLERGKEKLRRFCYRLENKRRLKD